MAALSDFWLLHGFKSPQDTELELERVPEWRPLAEHFLHRDTAALYRHLMLMPQSEADALLLPLRKRLEPLFLAGQLPKSSPDYWAALAFRDFELPGGHCDRGIFSIYLLHLAHIPQGQGIFQAAGVPHAYLEGQNVELMANSDNVFRGGLTPKYIAVEELLDNLVFDPTPPCLIEGRTMSDVESVFPTPAPDFKLSRLDLPVGREYSFRAGTGPEILFILQGEVSIQTGEVFHSGEVMYLLPEADCRLLAAANSVLFKAAVS
jgi:mannose-6-phosphate isomerase